MSTSRLLSSAHVVVGLVCALTCGTAHAQDELTLREGVTCLRMQQLDLALEPGTRASIAAQALQVEVAGSDEDPRTASIRITQAGELVAERTFSPAPPRCADFHGAIALTLGIMLRSLEHERPEPPPAPEPPLRPLPPPPPARVNEEREPLSFAARASGVLDWGAASAYSRGLDAELVMGRRRWTLRAGVLALFSRARSFAEVSARYRTRALAGSLDACGHLLARPGLRLDLCGGLLLGQLHAAALAQDGVREARPLDTLQVWLRARLELALRLRGALWAVLALSPVRGTRAITLEARSGGELLATELPRGGALLSFGLAYDFSSPGQGSGRAKHQ